MEQTTAATTLESYSPWNGELVGAVRVTTAAGRDEVVADVARVQPFWAQLPLRDRARYMRRTAQVVIDNLDALASLLAREQGKPVNEAYLIELVPSVDTLHWIADHAPRFLADARIRHTQPFFFQKRSSFAFEPLGVMGVVAEASLPWSVPFGRAAIALMAGNGVVIESSPLTPLVSQRIQDVFERAGVPDGLVQVIHGDVRAAGHGVAEVFDERHGKDAQLVLADAHVDHAAAGCVWGAFANAGQAPSSIERVYVVRRNAEAFVDRVVAAARGLRVGDPRSADTEVGPLLSDERVAHVRELVDDAVAAGAELCCGGPLEGRLYAPAVLTGVTPQMRIMREEVRGPVVAVAAVADEEEALALANDARRGRDASVWSLDRDRAERIARRVRADTVWINDHLPSAGPGRSRDRYGFWECVTVKHVSWDPSRMRNPWWFPYDATLGTALHSGLQLAFGRDSDKRDALRRGAAPLGRLLRKTLG